MRRSLVPALLAAVVAAAGLVGVVSAAAGPLVRQDTRSAAAEQSSAQRDDTDLLTRTELFVAIGANASDHSADLYCVAETGEVPPPRTNTPK